MKKITTLFPILLFIAASFAGCVGDGEIEWLYDYDQASAEAEKTGKLMLVDIYTNDCFYCGQMDRNTYTDSKVLEKSKEFICLKNNAGDDPALYYKYECNGVPTTLFLDFEGNEIHRVVGYRSPSEFIPEMDKALSLSS